MAQKKRQRILERRLHLADRIIAAALTTSTILSPFSVYAADSNIKAKGDWTTVKTSGSKHAGFESKLSLHSLPLRVAKKSNHAL